MKAWNFKVRSNSQEIINKLNSTLGSAKGFVFNMDHDENDSVTFKIRKRGLYAFYLMFINKVILNGKILKTDIENETNIEISFTQYFLWKLLIFTHMFLGFGFLIAIFSGMINNPSLFMLGGVILVLGIVLWIAVQKKFEKDVQEYKTLISKILEF